MRLAAPPPCLTTRLLPLLWLMGATAACGGVQKTEQPSRGPHATTVEIRNLKPVDFTVYVLMGTDRLRLGMAPAMTTRTFVIPPHVLHTQAGRMRFGLDVIEAFSVSTSGASWSDSGPFGYESMTEAPLVRPGDQLAMTLEPLEPLNPVILRSINQAGEKAGPAATCPTVPGWTRTTNPREAQRIAQVMSLADA